MIFPAAKVRVDSVVWSHVAAQLTKHLQRLETHLPLAALAQRLQVCLCHYLWARFVKGRGTDVEGEIFELIHVTVESFIIVAVVVVPFFVFDHFGTWTGLLCVELDRL